MNIGFNLAILHSSGKVDSFIDRFIILVKGRTKTSAPSLRNLSSIPATLLVSRLSKIFSITSSDTFDNSESLDTFQKSLGVVVFGCLANKCVG